MMYVFLELARVQTNFFCHTDIREASENDRAEGIGGATAGRE
jgi:hypothetical protein